MSNLYLFSQLSKIENANNIEATGVTRRNYPPSPQKGGDTFQEFTTCENYPPLPLQKNKVNHINKIIMTKLSLMHPYLFSLKNKNQFVLRI